MKTNEFVKTEFSPFLSICIPTYNRSALAYRCVMSALEFPHDDIEIVVCDNGSDDDTFENLSQIDDVRLKLFKNNVNMGYKYNVIRVAKEANGRFCMLCSDEDLIVQAGLLELLEYLKANADIAVMGVSVKKYDNSYFAKYEHTTFAAGFEGYRACETFRYISGVVFNRTYIDFDNITLKSKKYLSLYVHKTLAQLAALKEMCVFSEITPIVYTCETFVLLQPSDAESAKNLTHHKSLTYTGKNLIKILKNVSKKTAKIAKIAKIAKMSFNEPEARKNQYKEYIKQAIIVNFPRNQQQAIRLFYFCKFCQQTQSYFKTKVYENFYTPRANMYKKLNKKNNFKKLQAYYLIMLNRTLKWTLGVVHKKDRTFWKMLYKAVNCVFNGNNLDFRQIKSMQKNEIIRLNYAVIRVMGMYKLNSGLNAIHFAENLTLYKLYKQAKYSEILATAPNAIYHYYWHGKVYLLQENETATIAAFEQYIAIYEDGFKLNRIFRLANRVIGRLPKVLRKRIRKFTPKYDFLFMPTTGFNDVSQIYYELGRLYAKDNPQKARKYLKKCKKLLKSLAEPRHIKAEALLEELRKSKESEEQP
ncbi:MAG: glycosyltransferase family 2 protein [Turicibacter sp.]|nr:glycosyltransferase family 2 protein [Turicibacter sp.]